MKELWRSKSPFLAAFLVCNFYLLNLSFCWSLNGEGVALLRFKGKIVSDPHGALTNWIDEVGLESHCSWFGVECSEGYVVGLNLKDLCLRGTLAPHIGNLAHVKSIILRNNSFSGAIPEEIANLKELEVLDLGYNNFSGQLPCHLGNNFSMTILLLDNNELLDSTRPEMYILQKLSEVQVVEDLLLSRPNQASSSIVGPVLLLLLIIGIFCYRSGKVASVKPWATGLSGQLQRAFVTGVPKLKRSELEAACEDFSNVIGSSSVCNFYKGTLSSGVEIAVVSVAMASAKDWSSYLEAQFRKKIDTLSKVNHKNFASLLGFCEEQEPFTRMMVFDKRSRTLGLANAIENRDGHSILPGPHASTKTAISPQKPDLIIYLPNQDYAAKLSDFAPYSAGSDSLEDWASDYLRGPQPLREMVDPTLRTYREDQLQQIGDVIRACADPDPRRRPSMRDVCGRLREITGIGPDGAIPKLSPLWWAEIEIMSNEA
ncbi:hypothetical protein DH2020_010350 [Rehmannia glutinosa]|uniref:Leucine-rich repeat-containing N-terminal plant-type domain-containing protein n=1 Tax=Rehmannia glutinosa TaxID=99300 RepID=A0ABR0XAF1_REHGL